LVRHEEREKKAFVGLDHQQFCRAAQVAEHSVAASSTERRFPGEVVDLAEEVAPAGHFLSLPGGFLDKRGSSFVIRLTL
jgi:hypothetical protein